MNRVKGNKNKKCSSKVLKTMSSSVFFLFVFMKRGKKNPPLIKKAGIMKYFFQVSSHAIS